MRIPYILLTSICILFAFFLPASLAKTHEGGTEVQKPKLVEPLQASAPAEVAYVATIEPKPVKTAQNTSDWHYDCRSQTEAVRQAVINAGLGAQWTYIDYIFSHESCNDPGRLNSIGAKGLGQAYGHASFTCGSNDIPCQLNWFNKYAVDVYGGWYGAYVHWLAVAVW